MLFFGSKLSVLESRLMDHIKGCDQRYEAMAREAEARANETRMQHAEVYRRIERIDDKIDSGFKDVATSVRRLHERNDSAERTWLKAAGAGLLILLGVVGWFIAKHGI